MGAKSSRQYTYQQYYEAMKKSGNTANIDLKNIISFAQQILSNKKIENIFDNLLFVSYQLFSEFTDITKIKSDVSIDNHFAIIIKDQGEDCKKVIIPTEIEDFDISHKFIKIIVGKKSSDANLINKIKDFLK